MSLPYNKSFTYQACSVKTAGYLPLSYFCVFISLDFVSLHFPNAWLVAHIKMERNGTSSHVYEATKLID